MMDVYSFIWILILFHFSNGLNIGLKDTNIAVNKVATQFQTYKDENAFTWNATLAVDGCTDVKAVESKCCSASDAPTNGVLNFWQVNLGGTYTIGLIVIYGRTDTKAAGAQMNGFTVYAQTTEGTGIPADLVYTNPSTQTDYPTDARFEISIEPAKQISLIRIERTGFLAICEVQAYEVCDDSSYGDNCTGQCGRCVNNESCSKTTGECPSVCESGWSGSMCKEKENVAFNMTASQTSTFDSWTADNAIDGCTNQSAESTCCSKTLPANDVEWMVDFGTPRTVGKVKIYGMMGAEDELAGFVVYFGSPFKQLLYTNIGKPYTDTIEIDTDPPIKTRMVTIRRTNDTANISLTICEFEAIEVCPDGFYGDTCTSTCGHCLNNETCYGNTGKCPNGCVAGWGGDVCKTACVDGEYGNNCENDCGACLDNATCDIVNGRCPDGCDLGYTGNSCEEECSNQTYGYNCNMTCGNCFNGTQCNITTGSCPSCAAGYSGIMCDKECESPSFGPDCSEVCNCANDTECNSVSGLCPASCDPGWQGTSCDMACQNFTYGPDCISKCGNCLNGEECNTVNGSCSSGCAPGWLNSLCDVDCADGKYGDSCVEDCGNCLNGETCDFETGQCPQGCAAGWTGDICKTECADGTFGAKCGSSCYCADRVACNKTTGLCPAECDVGISGEFCQTDLNRAQNKTANQSSVLTRNGFMWLPRLALDGNFEQANSNITQTCSATDPSSSTPPYWSVDMDTISRIDYIVVYGKAETSEELEGFNMYLTNDTDFAGKEPVYNSTGVDYGNGIYVVNFTAKNEVILAQYVYIALDRIGSLSLCEVRVFGECPDGTFGDQCDGVCYCADGVACDEMTGECPDGGCQPGWTGTQCNMACETGYYGNQCSMTCGSCAGNMTCDKSTGLCEQGCTDGWLTDWCNVSCSDQMYGADCNMTCGQCKDGVSCDHVTGECPAGCAAGFHGNLCDSVCTNGTFGENCESSCGNCVNDTICDTVTGSCDTGCLDGYVEPLCASTSAQKSEDSDDENLGAILGGVFGGLAVIIIIAVACKFCRQGKSSQSRKAMAYYPSQATTTTTASAYNLGYEVTEVSGSRQAYSFQSSTKL